MIAEPLALAAPNETVAWPSPATAETDGGASGTATGTTAFDAPDGEPVPMAFVAVTVKV